MQDEQVRHYFQLIQQQITALAEKQGGAAAEKLAALASLQLIYEEMQTTLEAAEIVEEKLLEQNRHLATRYQHYRDLIQHLPIAHLVTDINGLIREANEAIAELLNVPQHHLLGKPLAVFIAMSDRPTFRTYLNQLSRGSSFQTWQIHLCPRDKQPFRAELMVALSRDDSGWLDMLQISLYHVSQHQEAITQRPQTQNWPEGQRDEWPSCTVSSDA